MTTNHQLLNDIRRLAKELGRLPTSTDYRKLGSYGHELPRKRFGSWQAAIEASGLRYRNTGRNPTVTTQMVRDDVLHVQQKLGKLPSAVEHRQNGRHNVEIVQKYLGCKYWWQVLVLVCGCTEEEAKSVLGGGGVYRTTEDRLKEVRQLGRKLKRRPTIREARKTGIDTTKIISRCGKWSIVCDLAGLPKAETKRKRMPKLTVTNDALGEVKDDTRDFLKDASIDAIKEFFKQK